MSPPGTRRGPGAHPVPSSQLASQRPDTTTVPGAVKAIDGSGVVLLAVELDELLADRCAA